jgi:hypothetical protein
MNPRQEARLQKQISANSMALPVPGHLGNKQFSSEFARIPWLLETFTDFPMNNNMYNKR